MIQETQTKRPKSKTANSQLEFRKHFRLQLFHWHSGIPILCGCLFRNWLRRWIRRCDAVIRSSKDNSSHRSVILVNLISVSDRFKPNLQLQHRFDVIIIEFQNQILNRSTSGIMLVDAPKSIPRKINLTETEFHLFPWNLSAPIRLANDLHQHWKSWIYNLLVSSILDFQRNVQTWQWSNTQWCMRKFRCILLSCWFRCNPWKGDKSQNKSTQLVMESQNLDTDGSGPSETGAILSTKKSCQMIP